MKETKESRIRRLIDRKEALLRKMNTLRSSPEIRNVGLKMERLYHQIQKVTDKITELKGD